MRTVYSAIDVCKQACARFTDRGGGACLIAACTLSASIKTRKKGIYFATRVTRVKRKKMKGEKKGIKFTDPPDRSADDPWKG